MYGAILIFCILVTGFATLDLPLDKCRLEDSPCMVKAFQKGIPLFTSGLPDYDIDVMDVMVFDEDVHMDMAGLSFTFTNGRLKGLKNVIIKNVKWDVNKKTIYLDYEAPSLTVSGNYKADGQILILPIRGDGQIKIKIKNEVVKMKLFIEERKKDDKTYVFIKDFKYDFDIKGNAHYNLTNLFNGNKELSDVTLAFINSNWKDVTNEFGRPLMDAVGNQTFKNVNKFLSKSPLEDISLSYQ